MRNNSTRLFLTLNQHFIPNVVYSFLTTAFLAQTMKCPAENVQLLGTNVFDKSYHHIQQVFDQNIVELLIETLQLNVSLVTTPLVTDFESYKNNSDNWINEQIVNGTADMSSSTVILTPESKNIVSYSFGIGPFRPQLYYKARSLREDNNIYLLPFSSELWLCLILTVLLLIAALTFILSREAKLPHEISYDVLARIIDVQEDRDEEFVQDVKSTPKEVLLQKEKWEMGEILLVCLGAPCQQGSARDPSTKAARIIILCMFGLAVVGYTAYSASLISLVSLFPSNEREQTRNVEYFLNQYGTLFYSVSTVQDLQLEFMDSEFTSLRKGFSKTIQGESVFVGDRDVSLTFLHQEKYNASVRCTLGRNYLGVEFQKVLVLKKDSTLLEKINHKILHLKEFGLLHRERKRTFYTEPPCTVKEKLSTSNFVSFNKKDVQPVVNLYILGLLASLLLLLLENAVFLCPQAFKRFLLQLTIKKSQKIQPRQNDQYELMENKNSIYVNELIAKF